MVTQSDINKLLERYPEEEIDRLLGNGVLTLARDVSAARLNMVITQLSQTVHLNNSEVARISTGYEGQYGKRSDGKKVSDANYRIVNKIYRHSENPYVKYMLILQDIVTGEFTVLENCKYTKMADNHGYMKDFTEVDYKNEGSIIQKGETIYRSHNHDEFGNYKYGLNAKVAYLSLQDVSDDAVVISESFAKRASYNTITVVEIPIGLNDIMLNLFGDNNEFKFIPKIGEYINDKKGILCAKRTIEYNKSSSSITNNALKEIWNNDKIYGGRGMILDFDIHVNNRYELDNGKYRKQLKEIYEEQLRYNSEIVEALTPIVNNKSMKKSSVLIHKFNEAMRYVNNSMFDGKSDYKYSNNNGMIEFASLSVTLLNENYLKATSKIANRFGAKCVVTKVMKDKDMPRDIYGNTAEVIMSACSTVERANFGQLYEHELNFCADRIIEQMSKMNNIDDKMNHLLEFFYLFNPEQGDALKRFYASSSIANKTAFLDEIISNKNLVIHQPPFFGTISLKQLGQIYDRFDIKPNYCRFRVEFGNVKQYPYYVTQTQFDKYKKVALDFPEGTKPDYTPSIGDIFRYTQMQESKGGNKKMRKQIEENVVKTENGNFFMVGDTVTAGDIYRHRQRKESILESLTNFFKIIKDAKDDLTEKEFLKDETIVTIEPDGTLVRDMRTDQKIIIADEYMIVLKQSGESGFSARGTGAINQMGIPVKSKKENSAFSKTPCKIESMGLENLLRRLPIETVVKFISQRSSNMHYRQRINEMLLTGDPLDSVDLDIPVDRLYDSIPARMLDEHLRAIGVEVLIDGTEDIHEFFDDKERFPTHESMLKYLEDMYQEALKESKKTEE